MTSPIEKLENAQNAGVPGSIPGRGVYFIDDKSGFLEKWGVEELGYLI
jgi:hypothetical protein